PETSSASWIVGGGGTAGVVVVASLAITRSYPVPVRVTISFRHGGSARQPSIPVVNRPVIDLHRTVTRPNADEAEAHVALAVVRLERDAGGGPAEVAAEIRCSGPRARSSLFSPGLPSTGERNCQIL